MREISNSRHNSAILGTLAIARRPPFRHAEHRGFGRIRNGGGLVDFCLLGADLNTEVHSEGCSSCLFAIKGAWIQLREPKTAEERAHLERHGQGPYRVSLRSRDGPIDLEEGSQLDPALFSGAMIAIG